jgi:hypothetical protein
MRKKYFTLAAIALAALLCVAAATAFAIDRNADATVKTARADVTVMPQADVRARPPGAGARTAQDFRDSAALVLVGSMLLGLAAAVRRTV